MFDSFITGDETWVHFYEPKRKVDNRIWALKHAKRPSIAKRTLKESVIHHFLQKFWENCCPKGRGVSGSFYKNVVLKKLGTKNEKSMSKNWSPACPFVT